MKPQNLEAPQITESDLASPEARASLPRQDHKAYWLLIKQAGSVSILLC